MVTESCAFWVGFAFFDPTVVMPVLVAKLGGSDWVVGLTRLIQTLGFTLPALLAAHYIHGRRLHKPFLLATCAWGRIGLITLPIALLMFGKTHPTGVLVWLLFLYAIFWLMDGGCAVSWFDIIGKTIPPQVRGRFFGAMQTFSGIAAVGSGLIAQRLLASTSMGFPVNFAVLAIFWCVGLLISQVLLMLIREPPGVQEDNHVRLSLKDYLKQAVPLLRQRPRFAKIVLARVLLDGSTVALPFYVLFAQRDLRAGAAQVGIYLVCQNVGRIATGHLWGWTSDRFGPVAGLRCVAVTAFAAPALALASSNLGLPGLMLGVFFLLGAAQDGLWTVCSNSLIEAVSDTERPLAMAVASFLQIPGALFAPIGGLIAQMASYPVVFGVALGFTLAGFIATLRVSPRAATI